MKPFQPLREPTPRYGQSRESYLEARRERRELNDQMHIAYLEVHVDFLQQRCAALEDLCDELRERVVRLEAQQ